MSGNFYTGPVCYRDGWHYTVDENEQPGQRLHLEDTANGAQFRYRLATDADTRSWHERKHGQFATVQFENEAVSVSADELEAVKHFLDERRGQ